MKQSIIAPPIKVVLPAAGPVPLSEIAGVARSAAAARAHAICPYPDTGAAAACWRVIFSAERAKLLLDEVMLASSRLSCDGTQASGDAT